MSYISTEIVSEFIRPIVEANIQLQEYVSEHSDEISEEMLLLLSNLDLAVLNYGKD